MLAFDAIKHLYPKMLFVLHSQTLITVYMQALVPKKGKQKYSKNEIKILNHFKNKSFTLPSNN